jgi:hypothetical protein
MAYPGTLNISYYKGDTYEFNVYPKDSSGAIFDLTTFGNAKFTIATSRGATPQLKIEAFAEISSDKTYVKCAIRPGDATLMGNIKNFVYDVEISKSGVPYSIVYTLLNGTISVTDQVTGA